MTPIFIRQLNIQQYIDYIAQNPTQMSDQITNASDAINSSKLAADASVFIVWALAGVAGYLLISSIFQAVKRSIATIDDVEHAVVDRKSAERELFEKIIIQLSAVILLYCLYILVKTLILPTLTVLSLYALTQGASTVFVSLLAMVAILFLTIHLVVVLLRFALLRTRLFFGPY